MGLVCFRLKDDPTNKLNKKLLETINESGKLHMVPSLVHDKYVIRFCVVAEHATEEDIGNIKQIYSLIQTILFKLNNIVWSYTNNVMSHDSYLKKKLFKHYLI